jgi:hypothetical protein
MRNIDLEHFSRNLLLTQRYCDEQLSRTDKNLASILRSINPMHKGEPLFSFTLQEVSGFYCFYSNWERDPIPYPHEEEFINELFYLQIKAKEDASPADKDKVYEGAIVVCSVNETVLDGASAVSSFGLFDDKDFPPIDTWFYYQYDKLFAWIPEPFLRYAEEAIAVNCVDCIQWLAVEDPTLASILDVKIKWTEFIKNIDGLPPYLQL